MRIRKLLGFQLVIIGGDLVTGIILHSRRIVVSYMCGYSEVQRYKYIYLCSYHITDKSAKDVVCDFIRKK